MINRPSLTLHISTLQLLFNPRLGLPTVLRTRFLLFPRNTILVHLSHPTSSLPTSRNANVVCSRQSIARLRQRLQSTGELVRRFAPFFSFLGVATLPTCHSCCRPLARVPVYSSTRSKKSPVSCFSPTHNSSLLPVLSTFVSTATSAQLPTLEETAHSLRGRPPDSEDTCLRLHTVAS